MTAPLLDVSDLSKVYGTRRRWFGGVRTGGFAAVQDVAFSVRRGETLGIVGESGSGKSTTARLLMRLVEPTTGQIRLNGRDLRSLDAESLRRERRAIQMVFQDPFSSLNPRLRIGAQIGEPIRIHGLADAAAIPAAVGALLARVGLDPSRENAFPHELSGGQRQRVAIARALAAEPQLIIADEAVSALDVSVRAQILNLFDDLKRSTDLALIFISHDLAVVRHLVDRIAVMYRGRIVETGPSSDLFETPRHPYTRALLSAMPAPHVGIGRDRFKAAPATPEPATGCPYAHRCPLVAEVCRRERPALALVTPGQSSACFRAGDVEPLGLSAAPGISAAELRLRNLQAQFASREGRAA